MTVSALSETGCPMLWLWAGGAMYRGPSLNLGPHSGAVACFAVALDSTFTVRAPAGATTARSALIPARLTHQFTAHGDSPASPEFLCLVADVHAGRRCGNRGYVPSRSP
ncbi:hypothetical protein [Alloactinosynnema sp. L-07]|uniref:hypothetical protein n=1 Tax=Alloactinosynnema sp. L-07 TaxID=1653480 RepID=UPI0012F927AB|nr:hypothetical protein [Alloactinosynnema sp. L-07]